MDPAADPAVFPATPEESTWTSTSDPSDPTSAFVVSCSSGSFNPWGTKGDLNPLRCVRDAGSAAAP